MHPPAASLRTVRRSPPPTRGPPDNPPATTSCAPRSTAAPGAWTPSACASTSATATKPTPNNENARPGRNPGRARTRRKAIHVQQQAYRRTAPPPRSAVATPEGSAPRQPGAPRRDRRGCRGVHRRAACRIVPRAVWTWLRRWLWWRFLRWPGRSGWNLDALRNGVCTRLRRNQLLPRPPRFHRCGPARLAAGLMSRADVWAAFWLMAAMILVGYAMAGGWAGWA